MTSTSTQVASSTMVLLLRRVLVTGLTAVTGIVMARSLRTEDFGVLSSSLAVYYLLATASDFGFGTVLARSLGNGGPRGDLTRAVLAMQTRWTLLLTAAGAVTVAVVGAGSLRGECILVLLPALAATGVGAYRQVFYATFQVRAMARIDAGTSTLQFVTTVVALALGGGAVSVVLCLSTTSVMNSLLVGRRGARLIDDGAPTTTQKRDLLRQALPIGVVSLVATAYATVDMTLLSGLVSSRQLAYYAAAVKVLSILVIIPGLIIAAGLPALSGAHQEAAGSGDLATQVWHLMLTLGLPPCLAVALYPKIVVKTLFGGGYEGSVDVLRVLALAGVVALVSNLVGTLLVVRRSTRVMIGQNLVALAVNIAGNLLLVPHYGIKASAWLTVATELLVCAASVLTMWRDLPWRSLWAVTGQPAAAGLAAADTAAIFGQSWTSLLAASAVFVAVMTVWHGWPEELRALRPRRVMQQR